MPGEAYIVRQRKYFIPADNDLTYYSVHENDDIDDNLNFELQQDPFEAPSTIEIPLVKEHHILWSMSYSVPVLYFNGWKAGERTAFVKKKMLNRKYLLNNNLSRPCFVFLEIVNRF